MHRAHRSIAALILTIALVGGVVAHADGRGAATRPGPGVIWFGFFQPEQVNPDGTQRRPAPFPAIPTSSTSDGAWVTYTKYDSAIREYHAYVVRADGSDRRDMGNASDLLVSPDGTRLASTRPDGVWISAFDGSGATRVVVPDPRPVSVKGWSPVGDRLLIQWRSTGQYDLAAGRSLDTVKADGTDRRVVTAGKCFSRMSWSPDGTTILVSYAPNDSFCSVAPGPIRLGLVPAGGGQLADIPIPGTESAKAEGSWSPDGTKIAVGLRDLSGGKEELRVIPPSGGAGATIVNDGGWFPLWVPNRVAVATAPAKPAACTKKGTAKADRLVGTPKADVLCGLGGNDTLIGKGGNDVLIGGPGKDRLDGGPGRDTAIGAKGDILKSIEVRK